MSSFKTIDDLNINNQTVLVRADLNVPLQDGRITDTTRIDRLAPTLKELIHKGAKVVVLSHFGRPKGPSQENSLKPIVPALAQAVGKPVAFASDCIGPIAQQAVSKLKAGDILLLENLRFHPGEEKNDPAFAEQLASLGQYYVNDAFSVSHRAHASVTALAHLLPSAAGRLMQAELEALNKALINPVRPVMAIVGGAKISTKLELLNNLVKKVSILVLGGGMANTFLEAKSLSVGKSLSEKNMLDQARIILQTAATAKCKMILPVDGIVAKEFKAGTSSRPVSISSLMPDDMILDIGPQTIQNIIYNLESCKTVVWNGPLGAFEIEPFDTGTSAVAQAVARLTNQKRLMSVAGGGDTLAALAKAGVENDFSYVSTAGGAFLEWLEGKELPGVAALQSA